MPQRSTASNRGPAAASDNRRAILAAARRVFAERGYHVPLSAISRDAGVGQGVLYRHFPTRLDLAFAVFDENFLELDALVAEPDERTFGRLWDRLLDLTIREVAFVEMVIDTRRTHSDYTASHRLHALIERPLELAQAAGTVSPTITVDDVLLAQRMAYGIVTTAIVTTAIDTTGIRDTINRALATCSHLASVGRTPG